MLLRLSDDFGLPVVRPNESDRLPAKRIKKVGIFSCLHDINELSTEFTSYTEE